MTATAGTPATLWMTATAGTPATLGITATAVASYNGEASNWRTTAAAGTTGAAGMPETVGSPTICVLLPEIQFNFKQWKNVKKERFSKKANFLVRQLPIGSLPVMSLILSLKSYIPIIGSYLFVWELPEYIIPSEVPTLPRGTYCVEESV